MSSLRQLVSDKLFIVTVLLVVQLANQSGYVFMGVYSSEYFTWGPNARLYSVGAPIDTWTKWGYLIASRVIGVITEAALGDLIAPWIATYVQGEDKVYLPYNKLKCRLIVQFYAVYCKLNDIFALFVMLTQADVAVIEMLSQALVLQTWTLPNWLRKKVHVTPDLVIQQLFRE
jgi:hypothetical protein